MKKNASARKLSLYFSIVLLMFSVIISIVFFMLFENHTIELQEQSLTLRAEAIATDISIYNEGRGQGRGRGFGSYLRSINSIAGAEAWIVDSSFNVVTAGIGMSGNMMMGNMGEENSKDGSITFPDEMLEIVSAAFEGIIETRYDKERNTISVAVPVYDEDNNIINVVLLHSPLTGTNEIIKQGVKILLISISIGLLLSIILTLFLSKKFTSPILLKEAENIIQLENDRKEFLAMVAHELKTPVAAVKSTLESVSNQTDMTLPEMRGQNQHILTEINGLQRLVNDILEIARLENPQFKMEMQEIFISDIISDVVRNFRRQAANKNIMITTNTIPATSMQGDFGRIRQMFGIVLDNAIKFSDYNSTITIIGSDHNIAVCDTGVGIEEEEMPYIFDHFHRSVSEKNKQGTGLGLSIALEIAKRHSIEISVNSNQPKGTCFVFELTNSDI